MRFNLPWRRKRERLLSIQGGISLCDPLIDELSRMAADKKTHSSGKRSGLRAAVKLIRATKLTLIDAASAK